MQLYFHRKTCSKWAPHRWTSTFFYSPAKWSLAGRFLLPPEPNMLSSESIIHTADTSSTSTPANYSATVCCHRAPHVASHANCMRANVNGLVYCWVPPPLPPPTRPQVKTSFNSGLSDRVDKGVFRVSLWLRELQKAADRWREIKNRTIFSVAFRDPPLESIDIKSWLWSALTEVDKQHTQGNLCSVIFKTIPYALFPSVHEKHTVAVFISSCAASSLAGEIHTRCWVFLNLMWRSASV